VTGRGRSYRWAARRSASALTALREASGLFTVSPEKAQLTLALDALDNRSYRDRRRRTLLHGPERSQLLEAQQGDLDSFAEIVRRHERRLRVVLLRILDDPRDVEEAVQDCFVLAWRHLARYRAEAALFTWLYRIGVNAALAGTRRKVHATTDLDALPSEGAAHVSPDVLPEAATEAHDLRARILAALAELPFDHREAVVLRDVAGLTNEEVAAALDLSVAAAKSRIHRGRLALRELLEPPHEH
jgi:RNA polymerase sigma-70 factor, ECF subfamily